MFGPPLEPSHAVHENGIPVAPLEVNVEAAKAAVNLVMDILLPQAVLLFNYHDENELNPLDGFVENQQQNMTKQDKLLLKIEKFIVELNYMFFFKSNITDRHFRDKRSLVDCVLNDLVKRKLLYEGSGNTSFFYTGRASSIKTYLKYIPNDENENDFINHLTNSYNINYDDYKKRLEEISLLPPNCKLSQYGIKFLQQPQYLWISKKLGEEINLISLSTD